MKKFLPSLLLLLFFSNNYSQTKLWIEKDYDNLEIIGTQQIFPKKFKTFNLDFLSAKNHLFTAPLQDYNGAIFSSNTEITIPMPDGSFEIFKIVESPVCEKELADKYPEIKTFLAYTPNHPEWYSRFDITPVGFHAIIMGTEFGSVYIDPISHLGQDTETYLVYYKKDFQSDKIFECGVEQFAALPELEVEEFAQRFGSCELRTYRLALAATGEYTAYHGGTVAGALAAQVTTMNRVNGVYEKDMAIHMNIIANNDLIIYTNSGSDPYTNNNGGTMLTENQNNVDAEIGTANYDIGHVFSTGGGGIASLQSPCSSTRKAKGVTGSSAPVSDPFDIDYVAHEIGHQFGGNHTFNGTNGSCGGGNRNLGTAFEPGSGTTIQAYANICAGQNVQSYSDDYFHGISLEEIGSFITNAGDACPVKTSLSNNDPSVTYPNGTISIPANTPFSLTALGVDVDGDVLTYCWEQMDNESSTQPPVATATGGPNFRSFSPTTNPTRYFPNLADVIAGNSPTWEVLPSVSRTMNFRVVVRDNAPGGGCNDEVDITVNIEDTGSPFTVTSPNNSGITWNGNDSETVTWDVADTDISPISCSDVNILISYDGGVTFPDTLAENVSNDGSQVITVPNIATTDAYIMVQCANGTFFDVSNNSFTISAVTNDFTLSATPSSQNICIGNNLSYNIEINKIGVFNGNVSLNTTGLPASVTASFSNNNNSPVFNSTLTISNTNSLNAGTYNFNVTATGSSGTKSTNLSFTVTANLSGSVSLTSPTNSSVDIAIPVDFTWNLVSDASFYTILISSDLSQNSIIESANNLSTNSFSSSMLQTNTTYYWSVLAYNTCDSINSSIYSFTTENCANYNSTDIELEISSSGTPSVTSDLIISGTAGTIADINVINLTGTHSYISDLTFTLTSPNGTAIILLENICNNQNNFNINFDDNASDNDYPCPPIDAGFYIPEEALSAFNNETANGTWILTIDDAYNQDGGELLTWGLNICFNAPPCINTFSTQNLVAACDSSYVNNTWYFQNDTYNDTLVAQASDGCDSIVTYNVFINHSSPETIINNTTCNPSEVGSNSVNYTNIESCDSLVTTNTTLLPSASSTNITVACDAAFINNNWYYSSTSFSQNYTAANGCDSVATFNITINNSSPETIINTTTCNASEAGTISLTLTNNAGCDSVVTTNTTLLPSASSTNNITECDAAFVNNSWYNNSTSFSQTYTAANGCDSVATFNITINNSSPETVINITTCNPSEVGSNSVIHRTITDCDSIVTTNTTLLPSASNTVDITKCDSAFVNNNWYYSSINFNQTSTAANGCDSVVTFNVTINESAVTTENISGCNAVEFNGVVYTSSQSFSNTFSTHSCDSTHTTNINVANIDTTITQGIGTLTANQENASYQWIDCGNNNTEIFGATNQSYTATESGNYAVQISNGACYYVSDCFGIKATSINNLELASNLAVYPNPTNGMITVSFNKKVEEVNLSVYTIEGKLLSSQKVYNETIIPININASVGVYFLKIETVNAQTIVKVIKE